MKAEPQEIDEKLKAAGYKFLGWQNGWKHVYFDKQGNVTTVEKEKYMFGYLTADYPEYGKCRNMASAGMRSMSPIPYSTTCGVVKILLAAIFVRFTGNTIVRIDMDFTGTVTNGVLFIHNRRQFDENLKAFDGDIAGEIVKKKKYRSLSQNRYYFGVVLQLIQQGMKEQGNDFSIIQIHDFCKQRFNYKEVVNEKTGEVLMFPKSTSDLTTTEFMDYLAKCSQFALEYLNVVIPEPNTQTALDFVNQ